MADKRVSRSAQKDKGVKRCLESLLDLLRPIRVGIRAEWGKVGAGDSFRDILVTACSTEEVEG